MSKPRIGHKLESHIDHYVRDAIHVPIMPVVAAEFLMPGQRISLNWEGQAIGFCDKVVGIVDPFLLENVDVGDQFYMFLKPESTSRLWHEWTHPLVDKERSKDRYHDEA